MEEEILIKEYLITLSKEAIIDLYLQKCFELRFEKSCLRFKERKVFGIIEQIGQDNVNLTIIYLHIILSKAEEIFDKALKNCSLNENYYNELLDFIYIKIKELKGKISYEEK